MVILDEAHKIKDPASQRTKVWGEGLTRLRVAVMAWRRGVLKAFKKTGRKQPQKTLKNYDYIRPSRNSGSFFGCWPYSGAHDD